jgi:IS66 Orf2 like protein
MNAPSTLAAPLMRPRIDLAQVYLCRRPVDFRKGMRALAVLVEQELGRDPFAETVYVFTNRRRTAVKCLAWERNGFCLWHHSQHRSPGLNSPSWVRPKQAHQDPRRYAGFRRQARCVCASDSPSRPGAAAKATRIAGVQHRGHQLA